MAENQPLTNGSSYGATTTPNGSNAATTKPATPTGAHSMDLLRTSSSKNPINTSSNVLLLYRMNELQHLGRVNFGLAVGTLLYLATNVVLFTFNAMDRNDDACGDPEGIKYARCGSPVSPLQFHIYEFWAGFLFACIEATSLIFTPRALSTVSKRPGLLRTVLMFDIMSTFIAAVLVTFNLDVFEVPAHEIEFSNELTLALVSIIFLRSLTRGRDEKGVLVASMIAICAPLFQLAVYNSPLKYGEQYAHAVEFTFGAANCFVTFWFCLDNWFVAEEELRCIKYGDPVSCRHCIVSHSLKKAELATHSLV